MRSAPGGAVGTQYRIDATSGSVLRKQSLNHDVSFQYRVYADPDDNRPLDGAIADVTPHPACVPDLLVRDPVDSNLITIESLNEPGDPWLPEGARTTAGELVTATAGAFWAGRRAQARLAH